MENLTIEELLNLVSESSSYSDLFYGIYGRYPHGQSLQNFIDKCKNLNIKSFKCTPLKNKEVTNRKLKFSDVLVYDRLNGRREGTQILRRALIESGVEYKCIKCFNTGQWNESKLVLQIDHKDNNRVNNNKENLRFLCPNCHSQRKVYSGRKSLKVKPSKPCLEPKIVKTYIKKIKERPKCKTCGETCKNLGRTYCSRSCRNKDKKSFNSPKRSKVLVGKEELIKDIHNLGYTGTSKKYGVSDNTIRKWVKSYDLDPKKVQKK